MRRPQFLGSRFIFLNFCTMNERIMWSSELCGTDVLSHQQHQQRWLRSSSSVSLYIKQNKNLKDNMAVVKQQLSSCCSLLSDMALASVRTPQTVPPTSYITSRTSRDTLSVLLGGGSSSLLCRRGCTWVPFPRDPFYKL